MQFTCFASTKVQILTKKHGVLGCMPWGVINVFLKDYQFTCFTSTSGQILTICLLYSYKSTTLTLQYEQGVLGCMRERERERERLCMCQYLYFCTSKASKLSMWEGVLGCTPCTVINVFLNDYQFTCFTRTKVQTPTLQYVQGVFGCMRKREREREALQVSVFVLLYQ